MGKSNEKPQAFAVCATYNPDCYTYIENGSKNHSGVNARAGNKIVPVYSCDEARPRCLIYLLDTYLAKFPPKAVEMLLASTKLCVTVSLI